MGIIIFGSGSIKSQHGKKNGPVRRGRATVQHQEQKLRKVVKRINETPRKAVRKRKQ